MNGAAGAGLGHGLRCSAKKRRGEEQKLSTQDQESVERLRSMTVQQFSC